MRISKPVILTVLVLSVLGAASRCVLASAEKANTSAPQGDPVAVQDAYNLLLQMKPDAAIHKLCSPLISALKQKNVLSAARYLRLIAFALRLDENDQAAAEVALQAVSLDPSSDEARLEAAQYLSRCGRWKSAESLMDGLCQSKKADLALFANAQKGIRNFDFTSTLESLLKAPASTANNPKLLRTQALLYQMTEQYDLAAPVYRKLADSCESAYMKEIYLGRAFMAEKKYDEARKHFLSARNLLPEDSLAPSELGFLDIKNGKLKEARDDLRKAVEKTRLSTQAHTNFAIVEAFFGSSQEAHRCLDHLQKLRPGAPDVLFAQGVVAEKSCDNAKGKEYFLQVTDANPYNSAAYQHLVDMARNKNLASDEKEAVDLWISKCPHSFAANVEAGKTYFNLGDRKRAAEFFAKASEFAKQRDLKDKPGAKSNYLTLCAYQSACAFYEGKLETAESSARQFNERKPEPNKAGGMYVRPNAVDFSKLKTEKQKHAANHALIADTLYEVHDLKSAEKEYLQALQNEPNNILWHSCHLKVLLDLKDYMEAAKEDLYVSQHVVSHIPDAFKK